MNIAEPIQHRSVAILIPCYNEALTIGAVIKSFRESFPLASIFVYDNNSSDNTAHLAAEAGAIVRREYRQGKGNVIRRMFADIEADVYVLVDGDDTYDANSASILVSKLIFEGYDLVNGKRQSEAADAYRAGHKFGNWLLTTLVSSIFGRHLDDMLSGLKVFSRRFVKSFPCITSGFEIETELSVHALELKMGIAEITVPYKERVAGSFSKLSTFRDGFRIIFLIFGLLKAERPSLFFGIISGLFAVVASTLGANLFAEYAATGLVPKLPTAVLATGLMIIAALSGFCGLILETVTLGRRETKRMFYLMSVSIQETEALRLSRR